MDNVDQSKAQVMKMILKWGKVKGRVTGYSNQEVMMNRSNEEFEMFFLVCNTAPSHGINTVK
jgi:hypothetical protein